MRISPSGLFHRHRSNRVLVSPQTLALTVLRSYGPLPRLKLIHYLAALSATIFPASGHHQQIIVGQVRAKPSSA